jgi:heme exporter protein D
MADLFSGKYAAYIVPAYAVTIVVFAVMVAGSLAHARRWKAKAEGKRRR